MILRSKARLRQNEAFAWVIRLTPGSATLDDLEEFKRWCAHSPGHGQAFREAHSLWKAAGQAGCSVDLRSASAPPSPRPDVFGFQMGRRALLGGIGTVAAAAAAGFFTVRPPLGLWPSLSDMLNADYRTGIGERYRMNLAGDGSIELNTRTSIALRSREGETARIELMTGEGLITTKGRILEVISGPGRTLASTATFNIRVDGRSSKVTCLDGTVQVNWGSTASLLQPRQQVTYSDKGVEPVVVVDPVILTAWRTGDLIFHEARVRDVISETNRYRHGKIILMNRQLGDRVVNARFRIDRIDAVITEMTSTFGATATSLPEGIVILS